ncbi:MAG: response regulator [Xanthobacteraceae bacterium]
MDKNVSLLMQLIKVLVVEDEPYTRKVIRTLLSGVGVKNVHEASNGAEGLAAVRAIAPDIVLLDWDMPQVNGAEFMRTVRSPATFPYPNVPVIMLTAHGEKSRVVEAVKLGVHEYLVKPVSSQALLARMVVVLAKPRPIVQIGNYYGPEPRKISSYKPNDVSLERVGLSS